MRVKKTDLKELHEACLDGLALVDHCLAAHLQAANTFRRNVILLQQRLHHCQAATPPKISPALTLVLKFT
jgi:hypothetical protein